METQQFKIAQIPAMLWGADSQGVIVAVHGNLSNKADKPVEVLARQAQKMGWQVLSFDLPGHGKRSGESCKTIECVQDMNTVLDYAKARWSRISLFGCSMGAYLCLAACQKEQFEKSIFLSPVVDMREMAEGMMAMSEITPEMLFQEREITASGGQPLFWEDYQYVTQHPICAWKTPCFILYGEQDNLCRYETVKAFAGRFGGEITVVENGEHYFHTPGQMKAYEKWLENVFKEKGEHDEV